MRITKALPIIAAVLGIFAIASPLPLSAQQATPAATSTVGGASVNSTSSAIITSPQLVSELHGVIQVMGTANSTGMRSYFLETRPLNPDATVPSADVAWVPATLPASTAVQNGVLGAWDTTLIPDGLYELRLTVTQDNALSTYFIVTPLRINNAAFIALTAVPTQAAVGSSNVPTVSAQLSANVRSGDNVYFSVVGFLTRGSSASVIGISSSGSGWYYIQLSDGTKGWIAPNVVVKSGDFSNVPVVTPPPALPAFTPTATPGLIVNGIALAPAVPVCGQTFNVSVNVTNPGKTPSLADKVYVQDVSQAGTVAASGVGAIPAINPGANYVVVVPLTVTTYYNVVHQVQATLDGSQITTTYTLAQGQCNNPTPNGSSSPIPATVAPPTVTPTTVVPTTTIVPASPTVAPSATRTVAPTATP